MAPDIVLDSIAPRVPERSPGDKLYRGWLLAKYAGVQLGYRTPSGGFGKGRSCRGWLAFHPEHSPGGRFCGTLREARAYADSYLG